MFKDRAAGALVGGLIGDALGLGCHWYYDLDEMRRNHGDWIDGYTTPKDGRYHAGMKAGQLSQTGLITLILLRSVLEHKGYDEADFIQRLEKDLFAKIDGTAQAGPGGYTNQSIREAYARIKSGLPWSKAAGEVDTSDAAERAVVLAVRYAKDPRMSAATASSNIRLTHSNNLVVAMGTAFTTIVSMLVSGEKLNGDLTDKLMELVNRGSLPFQDRPVPQKPGDFDLSLPGVFPTPDTLLMPAWIHMAANDPGIKIEPASKAALIYGLPCAIYYQIPAAYYLACRFPNDFESAVLHAINGGGQNMSRAYLTGMLVGAQVGLSGIPQRLIEGLENSKEVVGLAHQLADLADA